MRRHGAAGGTIIPTNTRVVLRLRQGHSIHSIESTEIYFLVCDDFCGDLHRSDTLVALDERRSAAIGGRRRSKQSAVRWGRGGRRQRRSDRGNRHRRAERRCDRRAGERRIDLRLLSWRRYVVPHLDETAASSRGGGAGPAFVVGSRPARRRRHRELVGGGGIVRPRHGGGRLLWWGEEKFVSVVVMGIHIEYNTYLHASAR